MLPQEQEEVAKPKSGKMKNMNTCPIENCGYKTVSRDYMKVHVRNHSSERPFKCDQCDYSAKQKKNLKRHKIGHLSSEDKVKYQIKCPVQNCNFQTIQAANLRAHLKSRTHSVERPFKCDKCNYSSTHPNNLAVHLKFKHSKENVIGKISEKCQTEKLLHTCPHKNCEYKTPWKNSIFRHMNKVHSSDRPLNCDKCDYSAKKLGLLKTHRLIHLSNDEREKLSKRCTIQNCQFKTLYASDLRRHLLLHSSKKRLSCNQCDFSTKNPNLFDQHEVKHSSGKGIKNLLRTCPIEDCNFQTFYRSNLVSHANSHKLEGPFKCENCNFFFRQQWQLTKHHLTHLDAEEQEELLELCPIRNCTFKTTNKKLLSSHLLSHSSEGPFKCEKCEFTSKNMNMLKKHQLTHLNSLIREKFMDDVKIENCFFESTQTSDAVFEGRDEKKAFYCCKVCNYKSEKNDLLALHNEELHGLPYVVLNMLPV